jgi:hypothetical protein
MPSNRLTIGSVSLVAALMLAAGSAAPAWADGAKSAAGTPVLGASRTAAGQTALTLNGVVFRTTGARVTNQRLITFTGSSTTMAVWDEWTGVSRTSYFALSLDGRTVAQVQSTENQIRLRYGAFDPLAGRPVTPASLQAAAGNELYLVQFVGTPLEEMRAQIRTLGGVVERFLPDNTHVVRLPAGASAKVAALPFVRWVGAYEPAYRLSDEVRADVLGADAGVARYSIECMRRGPAQQQALADLVTKLGGIVEIMTPDQYRMEATLTPAQVLQVAQRNEVNFIDAWGGPGGTDMLVIRQLEGATPTVSGAGFTGQGVRGEVFDTEVLSTHVAFQNPVPMIHAANGNSGLHGSACYGINFAKWPGNAEYDGLCTDREQGIFFWYAQCTQFNGSGLSRLAYNTQAVDPAGAYHSCYQTSSVGSNQVSNYTPISAEVDDYLFQIDYLSFQSQSNTGSTLSRPQAWAKNIVSVGGVYWQNTLSRADDTFTGSLGSASFGPAQEGRQKPDLANCYDNITATYGTSNTGTTVFNGTSGATPITAACGGLVSQMWHQGVWPGFGGGASVFADRPYSTTTKALMINAAYRYPLTQGGLTRAHQGWGMPDLNALYLLHNKAFIINNSQPIQNGQTASYIVNVAAGEPNLNVTMCYIDPMANIASTVSRINDLSLRVTSPASDVYWGNSGLDSSNFSTPGGSENHIDTVENVFIQNPMAGSWTIEVLGTQIVQDAYPTGAAGVTPSGPVDAAFSLVATGVTPAVTSTCYANCDGDTNPPFLTINDFICFQSHFAAGDSYANCDGSTTPPVLNVNDFLCFQSLFAAGCSAP